ncbi:MAG TPA: enoyl-CoA hydratase/isomerase family protein [Rhizomicrobium sp.]|nr:enoyl-CoA hydratase/isomerase family protein [Rhizomicrobium sp.]
MGIVHQRRIGAHVALLELDNPPANALGRDMRAQLRSALIGLECDLSVRALILAARGPGFCGGDDLKEQQDASTLPAAERAAQLGDFSDVVDQLEVFRVPVIAAINGWCMGGGLELALACDIRIASTKARFTCSGVNVGLMASSYRLPRTIGLSRARHLLYTGLPADAHMAEQFGLVTAVHPPEDLEREAIALATRIASRAPLSVEATKKMSARAFDLAPDEALREMGQQVAQLAQSEDHKDALAAFAQKREPVFNRK